MRKNKTSYHNEGKLKDDLFFLHLGEQTESFWMGFYSKKVKIEPSEYEKLARDWINQLMEFLNKNNYPYCGEISDDEKNKLIPKLEELKKFSIRSKEEFEKDAYFGKIDWTKDDWIRQYLQEVIRGIREQEKKENELARQKSIEEVKEYFDKTNFLSKRNLDLNSILKTDNLENNFTNLVGKKIEIEKERLISLIERKSSKYFLKKALKITELKNEYLSSDSREFTTKIRQKKSKDEVIKFSELVFTNIVEVGINKALIQENPPCSLWETKKWSKKKYSFKNWYWGEIKCFKEIFRRN